MTNVSPAQRVFAELAAALGVDSLEPGPDGGIRLDLDDDNAVFLYDEHGTDLALVAPVAELPLDLDFGLALWLLRQNALGSELEPFRVATDAGGNVILCGRLPLDGLDGATVLSVMQALADEVLRFQAELWNDEERAAPREGAEEAGR